MATTTTNYNLVKPSTTDNIDISVLNGNFDIIDAQLKNAMDAATNIIASNLLSYTINLGTTWTGSGPYTQTFTIPGAAIDAKSKVDLQPDATVLSQLISDGVQALYIQNNNGTLTAYAVGAAPTAALSIQCTVTNISSVLSSIAITTNPTTTTYNAGTALSLAGMVVTATFADGSTSVVTNSCTSSPANGQMLTTPGTQTVTVSYAYGGVTKTATFNVTVNASVTSISVAQNPTTISYTQGGTLDLSGVQIVANYSGLSTVDVTSSCTFSPADGSTLSTAGVQTINVTYSDGNVTKTTSFNVYVSASALSSIAVTTQPTTTTYTVGDTLDLTGLVVTATYADSNTAIVTDACVFSPDDGDTLSTAGTQTVTVVYSEDNVTKLTSFTVTVNQAE